MFWILALSYWVHLLATVVWLGGLALTAVFAWPALRQGTLSNNQWLRLQKRFALWTNASLVLLLLTGFFQMTNNRSYSGFLVIDSAWAWAILLKHVGFGGMVLITAYGQFVLYPAMVRLEMLGQQAGIDTQTLRQRENLLLKLNLVCATAVLLFTALATAV